MTDTTPQPKASILRRVLSVSVLFLSFVVAVFSSIYLTINFLKSDNTYVIFGVWSALCILQWWAYADLARYSLRINPLHNETSKLTGLLGLLVVIATAFAMLDSAFTTLDPDTEASLHIAMVIFPPLLLPFLAGLFAHIIAGALALIMLFLSIFAGLSLVLGQKKAT